MKSLLHKQIVPGILKEQKKQKLYLENLHTLTGEVTLQKKVKLLRKLQSKTQSR